MGTDHPAALQTDEARFRLDAVNRTAKELLPLDRSAIADLTESGAERGKAEQRVETDGEKENDGHHEHEPFEQYRSHDDAARSLSIDSGRVECSTFSRASMTISGSDVTGEFFASMGGLAIPNAGR
jgi:hypothetical protein